MQNSHNFTSIAHARCFPKIAVCEGHIMFPEEEAATETERERDRGKDKETETLD